MSRRQDHKIANTQDLTVPDHSNLGYVILYVCIHPYVSLVFPSQKFAKVQMKVVVGPILKDYKILRFSRSEDLPFQKVLLIILILLLRKVNENYFILALCERIKCMDGTPLEEKVCIIPGKTIFGNNFDAVNVTPEEKWHLRRKLLTSAFHFNMLQTFNEIFKEESLKLLEKLKHLQHEDINIGDVIDE
uniref:Cytochrome P450 n=1 Tax=Glossina palpalis gambiensis TaxID=67801 RepID=A0A1B0ASE1_9MUSC